MIIVPALNYIFGCVTRFPKAAKNMINSYRIEQDANDRYQHLMEAIKFLNRHGGFEINLNTIQGRDREKKDTEIHVSIVYKVLPHKDSKNWIELHTSYCVDFSSWKALASDLKILEQKYLEVFQRAHGGTEADFIKFDNDFSRFRYHAFYQATRQKQQTHREP